MKVINHVKLSTLDALDPEARVAVIAHEDAQKYKGEARKLRRQSQRDQIKHMKKAASKLRDMADQTLYKGIVNATTTVFEVGNKYLQKSKASGTTKAVAEVVTTAAQVFNKLDWFGYQKETLAAEKAGIEADSEAARHDVKNAEDDVNESQRVQGSMTNLMQKMADSRHAAMMAALKG